MSQLKERVICWDMGGTLHELGGTVKPGIHQILAELNQNYTNVVTSGATLTQVERTLHRFCLTKYFKEIFGAETLGTPYKKYQVVSNWANIPENEISQRLLIIGDSASDSPRKMEDTVFIYHPNGGSRPASITKLAIDTLTQNNSLDFKSGFDKLYQESAPRHRIKNPNCFFTLFIPDKEDPYKELFSPTLRIVG